ncbi:hypothetical protein GIB67_028103, partial [Kingdonia uniflora]
NKVLNDVVHEQYVKSFEKLLAKLEEKTNLCEVLNDCNESLSWKLTKKRKECQILNVENTKLVEDMRIKARVDASNASLAIGEKNASYYKISMLSWRSSQKDNTQNLSLNVLVAFEQLGIISKTETVPSRDLQKKIDKLTVKCEDAVKRLKEKESFIIASNYRWVAKCKSDNAIHDNKIKTLYIQLIIVEVIKKKLEVEYYEWEAWRQAIKKEFHCGELTEKDDPTFNELFDQYNRFYTIA